MSKKGAAGTDRALANAENQAALEAAAEPDAPDHVDLRQGGAARIEATTVSVTQGGASRIDAQDVSITMGWAALVRTDTLRLGEGSSAMAVLSRHAQLASGSRVLVLIARQTSGDVRPLIDWRVALAAVGGYVLLRRLLGRREH